MSGFVQSHVYNALIVQFWCCKLTFSTNIFSNVVSPKLYIVLTCSDQGINEVVSVCLTIPNRVVYVVLHAALIKDVVKQVCSIASIYTCGKNSGLRYMHINIYMYILNSSIESYAWSSYILQSYSEHCLASSVNIYTYLLTF